MTHNWSPDFSISTQGDGGFVVVWEGSTPSVRARVFAPSHAGGSELVIDPAGTDPVALNNKGFALYQAGKPAEAVPYEQKAVDQFRAQLEGRS